jgi:adenosylcobinamide-phosphate synthase
MALRLGVRLGKPGVYTLNEAARAPTAADTALALRWAAIAAWLAMAFAMALTLALSMTMTMTMPMLVTLSRAS